MPVLRGEPCAQIAARARTQWRVVSKGSVLGGSAPLAIRRCLPDVAPTFDDASFTIYSPRG